MTRKLCAQHYVLYAPRLLENEERTHALGGDVEVHRSNVRFVQVLR